MNKTRLLSPSAFTGLALLIVITIVGYALVPAGTEMPVHWGPDGAADAYLVRDWALLMPLVVVAVLAVVFRIAIERGPQGERAAAGLRTAFAGLALLMAAIQAGAIAVTLGSNVDVVRIVIFGLGLLSIAMGNILPKSQPNSFTGMRLPWTMNDPANWQATNRLSGMLMMIGGVVLAVAALVVGELAWLLPILAICVLGPVLIGTFYSYRLSR